VLLCAGPAVSSQGQEVLARVSEHCQSGQHC